MTEFLHYAPYLVVFYLAFCVGLFSPGPNILAIVGTSMSVSRRSGVLLACGISTGSFVWASLAVSGVTAMMAAYAPVTVFLKICGGLYLLWLAFGYAGKSSSLPSGGIPSGTDSPHNRIRWYLRGLAVQLTNAKAILSWLALVAIVADSNAPLWVSAAMVLGCTSLAFAGHIAWAYVFSSAQVVARYQQAQKTINGVLAAFFGLLGGNLVIDGIKELRQ